MSLFQVGSRSVSGRCACFCADVVAVGPCAFCLFQVGSRSVSGRCTRFRDDVVAFGLCVCLVCFRYERGLCRIDLRVFVTMSLRLACVGRFAVCVG